MSDQRYYGTAAREFQIFTPGLALKWKYIHPAPDTYDFCDGDRLAAFAQAHGMSMRGHTMVWNGGTPDWLPGGYDRAQLLDIMRDHITTIMHHYRDNFPGVITQWDIVNEPIADCSGPTPCSLKNIYWRQVIGDDYLDYAFQYAREADPTVKLYVNDYLIESPNAKLQGLVNVVSGMQARGVPIDGIGFQFHVGHFADMSGDIDAALQQAANLGLDVAVTELDVGLGITDPSQQPSPSQLGWQASQYSRVASACLAQPRCKTLVTWCFSDVQNSFDNDKPCMFDQNYNPKLAFHAFRNVLLRSIGEASGEAFYREAEDMSHVGAGNSVTDGWGLWTDGASVSGSFPLAGASSYIATVNARGNRVAGVWSQLQLQVDGVPEPANLFETLPVTSLVSSFL